MKKYTNCFICIACLSAGGALYILFRESTYLGKLFTPIPFIVSLRVFLAPLACDFLRYYLPDFLWSLALGCGLQAIGGQQKAGILLFGFGAFLSGVLWECMQFLGVISGTGDYWDIVSYFWAGTFCIILNLKETKK